jgi:hypothetical protein
MDKLCVILRVVLVLWFVFIAIDYASWYAERGEREQVLEELDRRIEGLKELLEAEKLADPKAVSRRQLVL